MSDVLTLVQVLAMIMFSEAHILNDHQAALAVGHVYLNRLNSGEFGSSLLEVASGFHAFRGVELTDVPNEYFDLSCTLIDNIDVRVDPTGGCLYIISYQDTVTLHGICAGAARDMADWVSSTRVIDNVEYGLVAYMYLPQMGESCLHRVAIDIARWVGYDMQYAYSMLLMICAASVDSMDASLDGFAVDGGCVNASCQL